MRIVCHLAIAVCSVQHLQRAVASLHCVAERTQQGNTAVAPGLAVSRRASELTAAEIMADELVRADAEVVADVGVFLYEFFINLLFPFSAPVIWCTVGWTGCQNRMFVPAQGRLGPSCIQFWFLAMFWVALGMALATWVQTDAFGALGPGNVFETTSAPVMAIIAMLHALRCATIAVKYAFFGPGPYTRLSSTLVPSEDVKRSLLLGSWADPSADLGVLYSELDRSAARCNLADSCLCAVFPTIHDRADAIWAMRAAIPSFLLRDGHLLPHSDREALQAVADAVEAAVIRDVAGRLASQGAKQATTDGRHSSMPANVGVEIVSSRDLAVAVEGDPPAPPCGEDNAVLGPPHGRPLAPAPPAEETSTLRERSNPLARAESPREPTGGVADAGDSPRERLVAKRRAMSTVDSSLALARSSSSLCGSCAASAGWSWSERKDGSDEEAMEPSWKGPVTQEVAASVVRAAELLGPAALPAKLMAWHLTRVSMRYALPGWSQKVLLAVSLLFACAPVLVRVLAGLSPMGSSAAEACFMLCCILFSATAFTLDLSYLLVGAVDIARRRRLEAAVASACDPRSGRVFDLAAPTGGCRATPVLAAAASARALSTRGVGSAAGAQAVPSRPPPSTAVAPLTKAGSRRLSVVSRSAHLPAGLLPARLRKEAGRLRLPMDVPGNPHALAVAHRMVMSLGLAFHLRVQAFTLFFIVFVLGLFLYLVIAAAARAAIETAESAIAATTATQPAVSPVPTAELAAAAQGGIALVAVAVALFAQILMGASANYATMQKIAYLRTLAARADAAATHAAASDTGDAESRRRIARLRAASQALALNATAEDARLLVDPLRVAGVTASYALANSLISVAVSGVIAAMGAARLL